MELNPLSEREMTNVQRYDLVVIGAGPAGMSAAKEAALCGMNVVVFDENDRPGGQLFKQIHKFFGSKEHKAKIRGFKIGEDLIREATTAGAKVVLDAVVLGIFPQNELSIMINSGIMHVKADNILIATGASENMLTFPGWTLPGVMGAGAAQTLMNLHGVKPGNRILMVGSGNVGLVVSMQLLQAGCEVVAVIDAAPRVGGYGVHAAKIARIGVPFYQSYTIVKADGADRVSGAEIAKVDQKWQIIPGTEKHLDIDTICVAVGLSPMSQLAANAGCEMEDNPKKGGLVPVINDYGETSIAGIFAAGDVSGIEEASSAMIEGRIAGAAAAKRSGFISREDHDLRHSEYEKSLEQLRQGMFAPENKGRLDLMVTDEGIRLSTSLLEVGYLDNSDIEIFPACKEGCAKRYYPVIECTQNIPCNPCQDACKSGCIIVGEHITNLPRINKDVKCSACGLCVSACPGQAIFLINDEYEPGYSSVSIPYELLPVPKVGTIGYALDRSGAKVCEAEIVSVKSPTAYDRTAILTMKVPADMAYRSRFFVSAEVIV